MVKKTTIVILIILPIVLLGVIFLKSIFKPSPSKPKALLRGEMNISSDVDQYVTINSFVETTVVAEGKNYPILGYDIDVLYDKNYLEFLQVTNLSEGEFDFFSTEKEGGLLITGIKKLDYKQNINLQKTPIVRLQFRALKNGKTKITMAKKDNSKSDSNLITENNVDILDKVNDLTIFIGKSVSLNKDETLFLDNNIKITLKDFIIPDGRCRDCLTSVKLIIEKNGSTKELNFKSGGFAGYINDKQTAFNTIFMLEGIRNDRVSFLVYEN